MGIIMTNKNARIFCKQNLQKMRGFNFFEANAGGAKCHKQKMRIAAKISRNILDVFICLML